MTATIPTIPPELTVPGSIFARPLLPHPLTHRDGSPVLPGDVMQHNRFGTHLRNLRDGYLNEGQPQRRAMKKQWYNDALAERFVVIEVGRNTYSPGIRYQKLNSTQYGECIADYLEKA